MTRAALIVGVCVLAIIVAACWLTRPARAIEAGEPDISFSFAIITGGAGSYQAVEALRISADQTLTIRQCDGSMKVVARSGLSPLDHRPLEWRDVEFAPSATPWDRDRVRDLIDYLHRVWGRPHEPPPDMRCDQDGVS